MSQTTASWLAFVRVLQALLALVAATLNGALLIFVFRNRPEWELPKTVYTLEWMVSRPAPSIFATCTHD